MEQPEPRRRVRTAARTGIGEDVAGIDDGAQTTCTRCHAGLPAATAFCPQCGASTTPGRAPGPVLPGYMILRTLGQGGAAVVYLARQESLDRQVAVKVLRRDVEEPKVWRHFRREARTIASLSGHPNVVTVYTAGRSQAGQPYLVTEFLDRGSLGDVIAAEGPLPPAVVAKVGVAVADALTAAHGLGILHRDVKPGNVMLGLDGRVKLGDFGIARLLAGQSVNTTDVIAFTPEHVAPEILRGEPDGPWSDLYGLASTLAAALVGAPLFTGRADERVEALMLRKIMAPPPPLPASVPGPLAGLVTRGLDLDPTRRPSLSEFRKQLAAAAGALGAAVPLPPPAAATTARAAVPAFAEADHDTPVPGGALLGPLRLRGGLLAIPALVAALVAATLAVAVLAGNGGDGGGGDASSMTSPIVAPTSGESTAPPSSASAAGAPASSTAVTTTPPATATVPETTPPPATTTVPATTAPPVATPAPSTSSTAAPRTDPPTTTTPAPTTTDPPTPAAPPGPPSTTSPAGGTLALTTAQEAETFVRSYYDSVAAGNYEASWSQLAPEFQRGKALSYEYYVGFWNDNDIEVGDVDLIDADEDRAIVNVELRWNGSTTAVTEQFTLRPGKNGELLIASQDTVGDD